MRKIKWPNKYKSTAMFTFDLDGDTTWENGNKGLLNGEKYIKSLSIGQYGPKRAVDMILDLLEKYNVKATFFIPGLTAERYPEVVRKIDREGHEIGNHGYAHERFASKTVKEQIEIIDRSQEILKKLIGKKAEGFRTPSGDWTNETPKLLYEKGFIYSSSMRGNDVPYSTIIDGKETDFIEIPTKWELDDYVEMAYNLYPAEPSGQDRISCYKSVQDNFIREFEGAYRYGLNVCFMVHPQVIGSPGRIQILDFLLKEATSREDVWIATGLEVARWCQSEFKKIE